MCSKTSRMFGKILGFWKQSRASIRLSAGPTVPDNLNATCGRKQVIAKMTIQFERAMTLYK